MNLRTRFFVLLVSVGPSDAFVSSKAISSEFSFNAQLSKRIPMVARSEASSHGPMPPMRGGDSGETSKTEKKASLSRVDIAIASTYFCNMLAINLSVITVPVMAAEYLSSKKAVATFVATVTAMVSAGGAVGKIFNGFVCERFGGRMASWTYLACLCLVCLGMSFSKSLAPIGLTLAVSEFLCSIQWTAICDVLEKHYGGKEEKMAKGISILSVSSTTGVLAAKVFGAGLLKISNWRTVTQFGAVMALLGAASMRIGVSEMSTKSVGTNRTKKRGGLLEAFKAILCTRFFWLVGIAHSAGYLARGSDRLLVTFIHDVASLPEHICGILTSSVTIGMVLGLTRGQVFSKMKSVSEKTALLKQSYATAVLAVLGLMGCGMSGVIKFLSNSYALAGMITLLSGIASFALSFQFFLIPNMVSATMFPEYPSVSLSWLDAAGYFFTSQVLAANSHVLGKFGWSASWAFVALAYAVFGTMMTRALEPALVKKQENAEKGR